MSAEDKNMLRLWTYDKDDGDYFVAESAERADELLKKEFGWTLEENEEAKDMGWKWLAMEDDDRVAIDLEEPMFGLEAGRHTFSSAAWCEKAGEGYLFSMKY